MDFSTKFTVRTDLADEVVEKTGEKRGKIGDGITFESKDEGKIHIDIVHIENDTASESTGKPKGRYVTVTTGEVWKKNRDDFEEVVAVVGNIIKEMLPKKGLVLVAGLGNQKISADAVGPFALKNLIVSRHIKIMDETLYNSLGLGECACIAPGVMGDTGAEAFELVKGAVDTLNPMAVVVVDALASRNVTRLAKTVQISDSGISPGSGVGNARHEISRNTLGVPTIAVGVPTVVEAHTLCRDLLEQSLGGDEDVLRYVEERIPENAGRFFVCPKETDKIISCMAKLVGYSINFALHNGLALSEMDEFLS